MTTPPRAAEDHVTPPSILPGAATVPGANCKNCQQPVTDQLTGVLDRREWDSRAVRAVAAARRCGSSLALILVDLDRFKAVNDTYGHQAGDAVLRAVAQALGRVEGAVVGRYGGHAGDEFLLLLPGATAEEAAEEARRAQRSICAMTVRARASRTATVTLTGQHASMGVAECVPTGSDRATLGDLLLDADVALREAKRGGGDLVRMAGALTVDHAGVPAQAVRHRRLPAGSGAGGVQYRRSAGELRIPLADLGHGAGENPPELVLSPDAAERLHAVLTELLGGRYAAAPSR